MFSPIYHLVRSVERISVICGWGGFSLGGDDTWKCLACQKQHHHQYQHDEEERERDVDLCPQCRRAWVRDVGQMDYSDAFERRMNIIIGVAGLGVGFGAWVGNVRWGWWVMGVAFTSMTRLLQPYIPPFLSSTIFTALLIIVLAGSILAIIGGYGVILFLMISNPMGERHWRHMTTPMYLVLAAPVVVYMVFMMWGVTVMELGCVLAPVAIGTGSLLAVVFMRDGREVRDEEDRFRLSLRDAGDKLSGL